MKKTITIMLLLAMLVTIVMPTQAEAKTAHYKSVTVTTQKAKSGYDATVRWKGRKVRTYHFSQRPQVRFVNTNNLTYNMLSKRKGRVLYIEIINGKVINNKKDGRVETRSSFNYISYRGTKFRKGDRVRTYCVYNPFCNAEDDIQYRFDERR